MFQNACYNQHTTNALDLKHKRRGMKVGYARVSTGEQNEDLQVDALKKAECEKWFVEKASGAKFDRKVLKETLEYLRPGDVFVVWKLDRAGRSLQHLITILNDLKSRNIGFISLTEHIDTTTPGGRLIFHVMGALAEFERDLIRERTNAGLASARARGRFGGRKRVISNGKEKQIQMLMANPDMSIAEIIEATGVSRSTLYRYRKAGGKGKE